MNQVSPSPCPICLDPPASPRITIGTNTYCAKDLARWVLKSGQMEDPMTRVELSEEKVLELQPHMPHDEVVHLLPAQNSNGDHVAIGGILILIIVVFGTLNSGWDATVVVLIILVFTILAVLLRWLCKPRGLIRHRHVLLDELIGMSEDSEESEDSVSISIRQAPHIASV